MAKALPKKYFPVPYQAKISYRKEDAWAVRQRQYKPYFDTWIEAYGYMLNKARTSVAKLERDLASAKRHLKKVEAMKEDA